jgi:hypothetical protein
MTTAADDFAVEDAFEAYLAGRPVPEQGAGPATFAEAVRATATQPGRPNAALAELLATGLLTDQSTSPARAARSAGASPSRRVPRVRRRRRFAMFFPALLAKILSAGAVAQAATGAGMVLVVATGAGATGLLGTGVQDTLTSVVASDETTQDDSVAGDDQTPTETAVTTTPAVETTPPAEPTAEPTEGEFDATAWAANGPAEGQSFGQWVRQAARAGHADGKVISEWARKKGEHAEDYVTGTPAPTTEVEQTDGPEREDAEVASVERGGGHGHGNSGGNVGGNGRGRN